MPATRPATRRSQPASGSAPKRSSSPRAATTSWPGRLAKRTKDGVLRHGVLLGRQADLVTDALRASALETLGYRVDVIEFVATEHTPKNVMLRAERSPSATSSRARPARIRRTPRPLAGVDPAIERLLRIDSMTPVHELGTMRVKSGLAEMLKGGVIMDVVDAEQAKIAEEAGACAVMALERVPADIRRDGGVARMSDPDMIKGIQEAVTIPVMAKCRIGHFAEAQILQSLEIDYIDESEVLTPADLEHHVDKWQFTVPFVCGCTNLGEALRRIGEGAAMIRTKGEAGTGDIVNAVTHMRSVFGGIRRLQSLRSEELYSEAKNLQAPYELVKWVAENGRLPVVTFTAGGIATPADASLCMQLGADGVFVGSGIFKSGNPV